MIIKSFEFLFWPKKLHSMEDCVTRYSYLMHWTTILEGFLNPIIIVHIVPDSPHSGESSSHLVGSVTRMFPWKLDSSVICLLGNPWAADRKIIALWIFKRHQPTLSMICLFHSSVTYLMDYYAVTVIIKHSKVKKKMITYHRTTLYQYLSLGSGLKYVQW